MESASPPVPTAGAGLAARLGTFAASIREPAAPDAVRHRVRALVADVVATAAAGLARPDIAVLQATYAIGAGPSSVLGHRTGFPPAQAAFLNAMPVAREQLQDGHRRARGHPASHVVPAVLAAAEACGADGPATLSAVLAGYETGVRIGLAMGGTPAGVHDIGTWATLGAAAGVAHVLSGGDAETIAGAIDSCAALTTVPDAPGVFDGWTSQNLYLACAAQTAVIHGQAAAAGLRAQPGTLERHFARWVAADQGGFSERLIALVAAGDWTITQGYLKRHPTCALLHGVNDAVEDLATRPYRPEEIAAVTVRTYAAAAAFDNVLPRSEMAARFSIPWSVAAGLVLGTLRTHAFESGTLRVTAVRDLAARVRVEHDRTLDAGYPAGRPATVTVRFTDGTQLTASRDGAPRGDGPDAVDDPVVGQKAATLLTDAVGESGARAVLAAVASLGQDGPIPFGLVLRTLDVRRPS
ncbi:MmgE/PrpD family protein [Amycolatopsis sp. CA-161197]|uniref:MmgE/PrpD family protein n=1 Tax=unclassified Amycolatopsis TaxID=2618356 RepID=UPI0034521D0A